MGLQSGLVIKESLSELKLLQSKQRSIKAEKRILCLILLKRKKFRTQGELADYLGVYRQTLVGWLTKYRKSGIPGIIIVPTRDKKSKIITSQIHQGLSEKLKDATNPLKGYWDAQDWVLTNYKVQVKYHWLRTYMIQHFKTKLKSPRKSHYKKDQQAIDAFLKTPKYAK